MSPDDWSRRTAPCLETFHEIAARAFAALPAVFRDRCGDVVIHVADAADDALLDAMGIDDALELSGLYEGIDLVRRSIDDPAPLAAHVHLFRLPILFEWAARGDTTLGALVSHVLVHEIGHHFGLSDDDMDAIEAATDAEPRPPERRA